jgi:nucleoid-associated protein YgaU
MALKDKYKSLIDAAHANGITDLQVREQDSVLYIDGTAPGSSVKQKLWDLYETLNPDFRDSDMVLNIAVSGGAEETYTVKGGDNLSKIAKKYPGLTWQDIYEFNKDKIKNPDIIQPGWELKIPLK